MVFYIQSSTFGRSMLPRTISEAAFPSKSWVTFFRFVKASMNIIDVLGVLPYFLSLGLSIINKSTGVRWMVDQFFFSWTSLHGLQ